MASLHYLKNTNYSGLLFAGRLADILGRKKLFLVGLVLYGLLAIITGVLRVGLLDDIKLINRIELLTWCYSRYIRSGLVHIRPGWFWDPWGQH